MQQVLAQLETVRRLGRLMLVARRLLQFLAAFCVAALVCGFLDYLLRFPGWLRLSIVLVFIAFAGIWLFTHLGRAFGFAPDLSTLALRAERLFPQLTGVLASGVEFATHSQEYADPHRTAAMARSSVSQVEAKLGRQSLAKLLNPTPTLRIGALALLATLIFAAVILIAPASSAIAAQRWLLPLGETQWPRRTQITSLTAEAVQPADAPLRLAARIDKGYSEGMRAWVYYQVQGKNGEYRQWQSVLMSEQAVSGAGAGAVEGEPAAESGLFERLIDLTPDFAEFLAAGSGSGSLDELPADGVMVNYYFKAGDDFTQPQSVRVVPRPAVKSVTVTITPPDYAKDLIKEEIIALDKITGRTAAASGLEGSKITLDATANKPVMWELSRFIWRTDAIQLNTATFQFHHKLTASIETPIRLIDEHGLENLSDRTYRIEMRSDVPPTVAMIQPPSDEMVLATATVKLESTARDDVAVESLSLEAQLPPLAASRQTPGENRILETVTGRADRLTAAHELDISNLGVKPGDNITLTAIAQDIFNLDGRRHDPVRSTPRMLRIVDAATFTQQIRGELAGLRQQAMRIDARQQELKTSDPATAQPRQEQLTQTLTRQAQAVEQLDQRVRRNKLNDQGIAEQLNRAKGLLNQAAEESQKASQNLEQARREEKESAAQKQKQEQAQRHQDNVAQAMKDLAGLLDEGKSALALQSQLRQLEGAQKKLADETRDLLPRTAGRNANELNEQDKKELDRIAQEQKNLARQADELVKQMKAAAEVLDQQGDKPQDKAAAQSLNEAANIAQRQGLKEKMEQAGKDTQENKLSQAGDQQQEASDTLQQMMNQMQGQQKKQQEMLRRMLAKLEESIAKLLDQQKAQLSRLKEAKEPPALADPLATLRRNTMAVAEEARGGDKTVAVAKLIDLAVQSQSDAIFFLRGSQQEPAITSESDAVTHLEEALKLVRAQKKKEEQAEQQQQREQLKGEYEKLAKDQDALTDRTTLLADVAELNRRQRAEAAQIAQAQSELQAAAKKLAEKVGDAPVFQHLHQTIDESATRASEELRAARASAQVVFDQQAISQSLRLMAKALDDANKEEDPFDDAQTQQQGDDAQQQGAQPKPKLVPDIAELRLLRGLQEALYRQTRAVDESNLTDSQRVRMLDDLANRQQRVRVLSEAVIQKLTNQEPGQRQEQ